MPELSIVIPAYNEEPRIERTLEAAAAYLSSQDRSCEVLVVDDGSQDTTVDRVQAMVDDFPMPLKILEEPHRGKGGAVRAGMLAAEGEWRLLADADLAMPFDAVPLFFDAMSNGVEVIIGSRQVEGAKREDESAARHIMGRTFNGVVRMLGVPGIQDTQCGYKMFSARAAETIFSRVTIEGFAFDVEALVIARRHGFDIKEIPVPWTAQPESKVRPVRDALGMLSQVMRIRFRDIRGDYRSN